MSHEIRLKASDQLWARIQSEVARTGFPMSQVITTALDKILPQPNAPASNGQRASAVPSLSDLKRTGLWPTEVMAFVEDKALFFTREKFSPLWREVTIQRNNHGAASRPTVYERVPTGKSDADLGLDVWALLQDGEAHELSLKDPRARAAVTNHPDHFVPQVEKIMVRINSEPDEYVDAMGDYGPPGMVYTPAQWREAQRKAEERERIIRQDNEPSRLGDTTTLIAALEED